jgi:hypothetical protein
VSDICSPNRARRNNDVFVSSLHDDARYNCNYSTANDLRLGLILILEQVDVKNCKLLARSCYHP